jgi:hypothetical protein
MKRIGYNSLAFLASVAVAACIATAAVAATPNPNGVKFQLNNFNTCPGSPVITTNAYPASVAIEHQFLVCNAFAENHVWRFSEDGGATVAQFPNNSDFSYGADLTLTGVNAVGGELGLNVAPWWDPSMSDGRVNCRVPDGEVACFGARMPFFSFTAAYGVHFAMNTPIHINVMYNAGGLTALTPGRVQYDIMWLGTPYSSGALNCDQGNPAEAALHGLWGILDFANVGGVFQPRMDPASLTSPDPAHLKATYDHITYAQLQPVAAKSTSWGSLKSLYR